MSLRTLTRSHSRKAANQAASKAPDLGAAEKTTLRRPTGSQRTIFIAFLAPAVVLTVMFTVVPFVQSFPLMFQKWQGFGKASFVGLENLNRLAQDREAAEALWRTLVYTFWTTIGTVGVGTALAVAFHRKIPFSRTLKFLAFLPVILPPTFVALAWKNALDPTFGWVNAILRAINPELSQPWLANADAALPITIVALICQYSGIPMILMLAALNDIPESVNEAATLDGVNAWQRIRHITLPLSRDVLIVVTGLQLVANFKFLDSVYALTKGGPGRASDIVATFVYRNAFDFGNFGYGSAAAMVSTVVIVGLSLAYTFFFRPQKMSRQ
ncbi:sugar ABC transporter permease [Pseudarthrobacter sp. CC12]|uniref:carbohydrate ABC transporter permease n=1 Tax=Pseudarthrobacter sp. CC12 TaxID=3029193 RepID=UPI003263DC80